MTTVRGGGSSIIFSTAFDACSVIRSASSTRITCQRPCDGARPATRTSSRASAAPIDSPSGHDHVHVGVGAGEHGPAGVAGAVAAVRALQRGGERPGRHRPARARAGR